MPRKYSRRRRSRSSKRTTKKKSMRRPKSKKIRGGVTVRAQDLTRLPSDVFGEIREMHPLLTPKLTNATIKRAVKDYCYNSNPRAKREVIRLFGKIENWDVSNVRRSRTASSRRRSRSRRSSTRSCTPRSPARR